MWSLYAKTNEAIAIQSSYQLLCDCLPAEAFVGKVRYIDYDHDWIPENNTMYPFVHKRRSFEHERELRALIQSFPPAAASDEGTLVMPVGLPNPDYGRLIPVSLEALVDRVYVAPAAPSWFSALVENVTAKYGLSRPVISSSLARAPVY